MHELVHGFHGTDPRTGPILAAGRVDVTVGGGELGQGFYLSQYYYVARAWAYNRHKSDTVVLFEVRETDFWNQNLLPLNPMKAMYHRVAIKKAAATRTYKFNVDVVWAPIVGKLSIYSDQYKY